MKKNTGRYQRSKIHITGEINLVDDGFHRNAEIQGILIQIKEIIDKNGMVARPEILKYIEQYPAYPQFKNLLANLYIQHGLLEKSKQVINWILQEHPTYHYGRVNKVLDLLENGELEEAGELLGKTLTIEEFHPGRKIFHLGEIESYTKVVVHYLIAKKEFGLADIQLNDTKDIFLDYRNWLDLKILLSSAKIEAIIQPFKDKSRPFLQKYLVQIGDSADFTLNLANPDLLEILQKNEISESATPFLSSILAMPRESVIDDLVRILWNSIYSAIWNEFDAEEKDNTGIHAWMLLGEMKAERVLPDLLDVLKQDYHVLNYIFGDFITEGLWWTISRMNPLVSEELILDFLTNEEYDEYARELVQAALVALVFQNSEKQSRVSRIIMQVLETQINNSAIINNSKTTLPFLTVAYLEDLRADEALPLILKAREVFPFVLREYPKIEDLKAEIVSDLEIPTYWNFWDSIFDLYKHADENWALEEQNDESLEELQFQEKRESKTQSKTSRPADPYQKVSRNAYCPCGSGKKYKRCHGS